MRDSILNTWSVANFCVSFGASCVQTFAWNPEKVEIRNRNDGCVFDDFDCDSFAGGLDYDYPRNSDFPPSCSFDSVD